MSFLIKSTITISEILYFICKELQLFNVFLCNWSSALPKPVEPQSLVTLERVSLINFTSFKFKGHLQKQIEASVAPTGVRCRRQWARKSMFICEINLYIVRFDKLPRIAEKLSSTNIELCFSITKYCLVQKCFFSYF